PVRVKPAPVIDTGPDPATLRRARALTISGAVTLSLGAAALGAMAGGLVWGSRLKSDGEGRVEDEPRVPADELAGVVKRGRTANALAISMGVVGGVLLGTGVGLLVAGRLALEQRGGRARGRSERAVVPIAAPGLVGMSARWRF
ncbi:MAG TPA: hypothetical protein VFG69_21515, partial [Nannocystaceae bacterium]|nr:hypothetical protein [Nannocystaceae bacterium]